MVPCHETLEIFSNLIKNGECADYEGELRVGVDLGTANIVIAVTDSSNNPIAGATYPSTVVKDGIVVDFIGAVKVLKEMKAKLEKLLGRELTEAATAIPPGITEGNVKCIANVVEGAGFDVTHVVDEPTAASYVLGIKDGAVVDVGGGTTGISVLKDGKVIFAADEPTGGTHMTLTLAGYYGISTEEAEEIKKDPTREADVFVIVKPVIEKMASITQRFIKDYEVDKIYVVGGACSFSEFEDVFSKKLGIKTTKPNEPLLVTPLGIAYHLNKELRSKK